MFIQLNERNKSMRKTKTIHRKTRPKATSTKQKKNNETLVADWKKWTQTMSKKLIRGYAVPLARIAENKLAQFQKQYNS